MGWVVGIIVAAALGCVVLVVGVAVAAIVFLAPAPPPVAQNNAPPTQPADEDEPKRRVRAEDDNLPQLPPLADPLPPRPMPRPQPQPIPPQPVLPPPFPPKVKPPVPEPTGPAVPPFTGVENPYKPGTQTRLKLAKTIPAPGNAVKLAFSQEHDLLFAMNAGSGIWVIDTKAEKPLGVRKPEHTFTDLSLSPGQEALFAADYGGEHTGYGTPLQPSYVHRYDLTARRWQSRKAPKIAWKAEAVDAERVLLLEQDQWVELTLNRWDAAQSVKELARVRSDYNGDIAYDPRTGRVYHGNRGISAPRVSVFALSHDTIKPKGGADIKLNTYGADEFTLSPDGDRVYYGPMQREALDPTNGTNSFPEGIAAASRDLAFAATGVYYDANSAKKLDTVCPNVGAICVSPDGLSVWVYVSKPQEFRQYLLEGDK
jgi:hypothetical protein